MITHESIEGYKFKQSIKYLFVAFGFLVILNSILITASYIFFKSESSSVGIVDFLRLVASFFCGIYIGRIVYKEIANENYKFGNFLLGYLIRYKWILFWGIFAIYLLILEMKLSDIENNIVPIFLGGTVDYENLLHYFIERFLGYGVGISSAIVAYLGYLWTKYKLYHKNAIKEYKVLSDGQLLKKSINNVLLGIVILVCVNLFLILVARRSVRMLNTDILFWIQISISLILGFLFYRLRNKKKIRNNSFNWRFLSVYLGKHKILIISAFAATIIWDFSALRTRIFIEDILGIGMVDSIYMVPIFKYIIYILALQYLLPMYFAFAIAYYWEKEKSIQI